MFRTCILPSKVLGEAPMMVSNFPIIDEVEVYDKRGNPMDEKNITALDVFFSVTA